MKRTRGKHLSAWTVGVYLTPDMAARLRALRWASQLLRGSAAISTREVLLEGLAVVEAAVQEDCERLGIDWPSLLVDAALLDARHSRVRRGQAPPREYGTGVLRPGQAKESTGGFGSLGIRPVHHEDRE